MSQGYDQFFKAAKKAKAQPATKKVGKRKAKSSRVQARADVPSEAELALKRALNVRAKTKPKKATPWTAIILLAVGSVFAAWGAIDPSAVTSLVDSVEVSWLKQISAAEGKGVADSTQTKAGKGEKAADGNKSKVGSKELDKKNWTDEDVSYFSKLNHRKKQLDLREQELAELETELHKQRQEVEARIRKLEQIREKIATVLKERVQVDEGKVNRLVEFYSNMKPKQAAEILATINEDLAVEILGKMKKKNAADIMNLLKPKKAQVLTEKFAGYKRR